MARHLKEYIKVKPVIEFLIALSTFNVFSGPLKNRIKILLLIFCNIFFWYFLYTHLTNTINSQININLMWTLVMWIVLCDFFLIMISNVFKRKKFHLLMQNIQEVFDGDSEDEEDEEFEGVFQNHVNYSMKVFVFLNRWEIRLMTCLMIIAGIIFRVRKNYGLIIEINFITSDNILWRESQYILQSLLGSLTGFFGLSMNIGLTFMGLAIITELNILNDHMKLLNEKIKNQPNFLKKVIKKHCSVINNFNLFSEIFSETSFMVLFANCVSFLFGFSFLMNYSSDIINYMLIVAGTMLSLHVCILGEVISIKSENLSETLYQTNWYELSLKDQKMFLIILGMSQREYKLKALGMYDVNLYTFVQISKVAFSYCAVLYSLSQ
uniref:Odorant receptor n=1 Tax=Lutzomyia longipalpis TaxID=7200 RepID=A0A3F2ZDG9_LUTLO